MVEATLAAPTRTAGTIARAKALPSSRAVVGALLIAASALGLFTAWSNATQPPTTAYVVAAHDLTPGTRLAPTDLTTTAMDLPNTTRANAYTDLTPLIGVTLLGPLEQGELVQRGAIVDTPAAPTDLEVSFPVEASRAVGGSLKAGEFVDVLATFGAGGDTYTTTVVEGATVLRVAGDRTQTLRIAVGSAESARALVHAVNAGDVVVVRAAPPTDDARRSGTYRAPAATVDN